jgi:hypothetical protein
VERIKVKAPIRVKLIARGQPSHPWARQTPGGSGLWGDCQFLFDLGERDYDWLAVIDDVSRKPSGAEDLACADEHTILITTEPPTITHYGKAFAAQFHHVLTSQDKTSLPHPRRIHSTTGNLWFHGRSLDELIHGEIPLKESDLSTVCSTKQQGHTLHRARYAFTQWLKSEYPSLQIYGHGVRHVENKHEALDSFRYHLAIENHVALHHWTEKFSDPLLSYCVPIYYGCTNLSDYFPKDSYLAIDINEPTKALETIIAEVSNPDSYTKRRDALVEARRLVLERYNMLAILSEQISALHTAGRAASHRTLFGRKRMRLQNPGDLGSHLLWKIRNSIPSKSAQ